MRPKRSKTQESALQAVPAIAVPAIAELGNYEVRLRYGSLLQLDEII